jgi:hypothetical protein
MERNEQFDLIFKRVKEIADSVNEPQICYVWGKILGYSYRMFQETDIGYILIKDENAKGSIWSAFYSVDELNKWWELHKM